MAAKRFNILFLGEASVGKTILLEKFADPSFTFTPAEEDSYWGSQMEPFERTIPVEVDGQVVELGLKEVAGSRGRMGNTWEVMTAVKNADCIAFCFNEVAWSLQSLDHTIRTCQRGLGQKEKKVVKQSKIKSLVSSNKTSSAPTEQEEGKAMPPIVLINLRADKGENPGAKETAEKQGLPLITTSALNNQNVREAFELIARTMLAEEEKKEEKKREKKEKKEREEREAKEASKREVKEVKEEKGFLFKLKAKVLGTEKKEVKEVKVTKEEEAPMA